MLIEVAKELTETIDGGYKMSFKELNDGLNNYDEESFEFLKKNFPNNLRFLTGLSLSERNFLMDYFRSMNNIHEDKSFGINNNGLSLLLVYTLDLIAEKSEGSTFTN